MQPLSRVVHVATSRTRPLLHQGKITQSFGNAVLLVGISGVVHLGQGVLHAVDSSHVIGFSGATVVLVYKSCKGVGGRGRLRAALVAGIRADGPGLHLFAVRLVVTGEADFSDGAAAVEGIEPGVAETHLGGMEAYPAAFSAAVQLHRAFPLHRDVHIHIHIVQRGDGPLVEQVHPHLEVAIVGHGGHIAAIVRRVLIHVLVGVVAVLAVGVHRQRRRVHREIGVQVAVRAFASRKLRGAAYGAVLLSDDHLSRQVVEIGLGKPRVPPIRLALKLHEQLLVLGIGELLVADLRVNLAIARDDLLQIAALCRGKLRRRGEIDRHRFHDASGIGVGVGEQLQHLGGRKLHDNRRVR